MNKENKNRRIKDMNKTILNFIEENVKTIDSKESFVYESNNLLELLGIYWGEEDGQNIILNLNNLTSDIYYNKHTKKYVIIQED